MGDEEVKVEESQKGKAKSGGKVVKESSNGQFFVDSDPLDVVRFVKNGGDIVWDKEDLPVLDQEHLAEMPYKVVQGYLKARAERDAMIKGTGSVEYLGRLGNTALKRLQIRKRRGYHQTWKRPDELEDAKEMGYQVIRKPKGREEPGKETGPMLRIGQEDSPELFAMEIQEWKREAYVNAVANKSKAAYAANKEGFKRAVEEVNVRVPREDKAVIVDDEKDVG